MSEGGQTSYLRAPGCELLLLTPRQGHSDRGGCSGGLALSALFRAASPRVSEASVCGVRDFSLCSASAAGGGMAPGKVLGLALECAGPRLGVTASVSPPGITLDLDQSPRPACEKGAGRSELCVSVCLCVCVWQVPRPCHVHLHVALRSLTCGSPPGSGVGVPSPFQYPAASVAKPPRERAAVACALRQPREPHLRALAGLPQPEARCCRPAEEDATG